jgi:hypothetical protein
VTLDRDCKCETCFLYHPKKQYCSLDGRAHTGCIVNYMPIEPNVGEGEL